MQENTKNTILSGADFSKMSNIENGIRLDRYLKKLYPKLTQGVLEKLLRKGAIRVNEEKISASFRISSSDKISLPKSFVESLRDTDDEIREKEEFFSQISSQAVISLAKKILKDYLLYDHPQFIAINKPAGLATQGGTKINISVDDALQYLNYTHGADYKLVHRLDKETSGVLLIAKNYAASTKLAKAFEDKIISKQYLAIVSPVPNQQSGEIKNHIAKIKVISKSTGIEFDKISQHEQGKLAITKYKVLQACDDFALIEFTPITGRMHQLRIHSQQLGCPIVGDKKYGGFQQIKCKNFASKLGSSHKMPMLLHANTIMVPKSIFDEYIQSDSLPNEHKRMLKFDIANFEVQELYIKISAPVPLYFSKFL